MKYTTTASGDRMQKVEQKPLPEHCGCVRCRYKGIDRTNCRYNPAAQRAAVELSKAVKRCLEAENGVRIFVDPDKAAVVVGINRDFRKASRLEG